MTKLYNKASEKEKRQRLRNNMPLAERLLWSKLRNCQLENCKFRRQYSVDRFVIDFYSPEIRLAIEVDGESHFKPGISERDQQRQQFIESAKITFLRFTNQEVYDNLEGVCQRIIEAIKILREK
jgi:very-short-patch-repair endonuclease